MSLEISCFSVLNILKEFSRTGDVENFRRVVDEGKVNVLLYMCQCLEISKKYQNTEIIDFIRMEFHRYRYGCKITNPK